MDSWLQPGYGEWRGLVAASLNQSRAPLDIRALAADSGIDWPKLLGQSIPQQGGWFILSTCNRFELYLAGEWACESLLHEVLGAAFIGYDSDLRPIQSYFDFYRGADAADHLFRVAAGMESKVFGESQILGQLIRAYESHLVGHRLSHSLDALIRAGIRVGKRVRHETAIGANAGSIGSLAIQTVEAHCRAMQRKTIAVIGLGEMGQLVARSLAARGAKHLIVVNRSEEKSVALATELNAEALGWERLDEAVCRAEIVFCATGSPLPVITPGLFAELVTDAPSVAGEKILVDLAVPRDVDIELGHLPNVTLIDLDQLQIDLDESLAQRHAALPQANTILDEELALLGRRLRELEYRPLIVELRLQAEQIRLQELARTLRHIPDIDAETAAHVEHLTRALVNKLLHVPTTHLRELASDPERHVPDGLVRELFGLSEPPQADALRHCPPSAGMASGATADVETEPTQRPESAPPAPASPQSQSSARLGQPIRG